MYNEVKNRLYELGIKPNKDFGQNFLIDAKALDDILSFGNPSKGGRFLEIGPGLGALTGALDSIGSVTVIEIEPTFCEYLKSRYPNIEVVCGDIRAQDLSSFGEDLIVYGNLPYSFSTDITILLIQFASHIKQATCLLQKEYAQRLAAGPGTKAYGTISITTQVHAQLRLGPIIPGSAFYPSVSVESQVIRFDFRKDPLCAVEDGYWLQLVTKAAFFRRRKKIANSMKASKAIVVDTIHAALDSVGISEDCRAETVSVVEYVKLAQAVKKLSTQ